MKDLLGERFDQAFLFAHDLHHSHRRKGSGVPYIAHLMSVTALVLENGGDEDMAIAALLHDAVEDQGGRPILEEIRRAYGERVASLVDQLSDSYVRPKPPWRGRKEEYLAHLRSADPEALLISLADKLHNARSLRHDLRAEGRRTWERFRGKEEGSLWYYSSLVEIFRNVCAEKLPNCLLVEEFAEVVEDLHRLSGAEDGSG